MMSSIDNYVVDSGLKQAYQKNREDRYNKIIELLEKEKESEYT